MFSSSSEATYWNIQSHTGVCYSSKNGYRMVGVNICHGNHKHLFIIKFLIFAMCELNTANNTIYKMNAVEKINTTDSHFLFGESGLGIWNKSHFYMWISGAGNEHIP